MGDFQSAISKCPQCTGSNAPQRSNIGKKRHQAKEVALQHKMKGYKEEAQDEKNGHKNKQEGQNPIHDLVDFLNILPKLRSKIFHGQFPIHIRLSDPFPCGKPAFESGSSIHFDLNQVLFMTFTNDKRPRPSDRKVSSPVNLFSVD